VSVKLDSMQRSQTLAAARADMQGGRFEEAERLLLELLDAHADDWEAVEWLAGLYLRTAAFDKAEASVRRLVDAWPRSASYQLRLAAILEKQRKLAETADCYRELIKRMPNLAVARFNFACFLKRSGLLQEALREHQKALDLNIDQPEEVLSNIAVICTELRRDDDARAYLERALAIKPGYVPAMYNFALLHEEMGDKEKALGLFGRILDRNPKYDSALARIAHLRTISDPADPIVAKLRQALERPDISPQARESLHFALGKVLDQCGHYDEAFAQFERGNRLRAARVRPYRRDEQEKRVSQILDFFSPGWLAGQSPVSDRPLVFISGMFRSGSTLIEQVLAGHPRVTAGGEIHYFNRLLSSSASPFPGSLGAMSADDLRQLGTGYLELLDRTFPPDKIVTNKRPDAFAYLGLLKALFPNAHFINTVRDPLDTCLSIYFQELGDEVAYANDLESIAHYYLQYQRLMDHWKRQFGASILDVSYDDFVVDPSATIGGLLRFLDLEWHEGCLDFQRRNNRVRTASVSQVREPIYRRSSGRWRHYERHLEPARRLLARETGVR
jgi:tetratricopeptide (TPR) repeat protein